MMARRMMPSMTNAQNRAPMPAGRSSSRMPSGVSTAKTVSMTAPRRGRSSGLDDDGVGNVVVQTASRVTEDEQHVDDAVQRNQPQQSVHDVAQPDQPRERRSRSVAPHDLDAAGLLADRLAVGPHVL